MRPSMHTYAVPKPEGLILTMTPWRPATSTTLHALPLQSPHRGPQGQPKPRQHQDLPYPELEGLHKPLGLQQEAELYNRHLQVEQGQA